MRAGVIAAGEGSRLRATGRIKPLVPVAGRPLCHWVAGALRTAGISDVTVLFNTRGRPARESLLGAFPDMSWTFLEKDTASSWESFKLVARELLKQGPCVITTIDAILPPPELRKFLEAAKGSKAALALTDFIDDEKPLLATLRDDGVIMKLGEGRWATCGVYYLTPEVTVEGDFGALRQFLTALVAAGGVKGVPVGKSLDVDRPEDVKEAERFITWSTA